MFTEYVWKSLVSKSKYQEEQVNILFPSEIEKFNHNFKTLFFPHGEKTNHKQVHAKFASTKCAIFYPKMVQYFKDKNVSFFENFNFFDEENDIKQLVADIDPNFFFRDIVKICMKKAFDQNIGVEIGKSKDYYSTELNNPFLYVYRVQLVYQVQHVVVLYLINQLVNYALKYDYPRKLNKDEDNPKPEDLLRYFNYFIKDFKNDLESLDNKWYRDTYDIANVIIDFFCDSGVVISQENIYSNKGVKNQVQAKTILWLTHKIANTIPFSQHLPQILSPKMIDAEENSRHFVNPLTRGKSYASISREAVNALNIAQKKRFKVNTIYLSLLDEFHNNKLDLHSSIKTPFPTLNDINHLTSDKESWSNGVSVLQKHVNSRANNSLAILSKKKPETPNFDTYRYKDAMKISDISNVEHVMNYKCNDVHKKISIAMAKRQLLESSISIAKIFDRFPIYYGTKLDYRTRMYPWEYLLSRTTGELKHLLCDFK